MMPWLCYDSQGDDNNPISWMSNDKAAEQPFTLRFERTE